MHPAECTDSYAHDCVVPCTVHVWSRAIPRRSTCRMLYHLQLDLMDSAVPYKLIHKYMYIYLHVHLPNMCCNVLIIIIPSDKNTSSAL